MRTVTTFARTQRSRRRASGFHSHDPARDVEMFTLTTCTHTRPAPRFLAIVAMAALATFLPQTSSIAGPPSAVRGIDDAGMDRSVAPGDDFFSFANGTWVARTEIPPDRSAWGVFNVIAEEATGRTRDLLEAASRSSSPARSVQRQVGDYYASFVDEAAIEAAGSKPLRPLLDRIGAIDGATALARVLGEDLRADVDPLNATNFHTDRLMGLWVSPDMN